MKVTFLTHAILILISSLFPFLWTNNSSTSAYTLQLCGVIVILYVAFKKVLSTFYHEQDQNILTVLATNSIIQLLVLSTGGTNSPLFFLYYFLIFAFALIYESYQSLTISLTTVIIYLVQINFNFESALSIANLLSLLFVAPLAFNFSKTMIDNLQNRGKIKVLEETLSSDESDSLLWLSTEAKPTLNSVINSVTDLVIYLKSSRHDLQIPKNFLDKIKSIQTDLITLYSSSEDLEESIKEASDNKKL